MDKIDPWKTWRDRPPGCYELPICIAIGDKDFMVSTIKHRRESSYYGHKQADFNKGIKKGLSVSCKPLLISTLKSVKSFDPEGYEEIIKEANIDRVFLEAVEHGAAPSITMTWSEVDETRCSVWIDWLVGAISGSSLKRGGGKQHE